MENSSVLKSKKKKKRITTILIILFFLFFGRPYYKPAYSGRIVDLETGEPIVGAMVDVEYWIGCYGPIEQYSKKIEWRRTKTDKDGFFEFKSYFTMNRLFSYEKGNLFSVIKKDYKIMNRIDISECLSSGCEERELEKNDGLPTIIAFSKLIKLRKKSKR